MICVDIDFISISEMKLDNSFPSAQFHTDSYFLFRWDRNKHGGGLAAFVESELLPKLINELKSDKIEILAVEININKRKWIFLMYIDDQNQMLITLWKKHAGY